MAGTASVPFKNYVRFTLGEQHPEPFVKAVLEYADSVYWSDKGVGDPKKHLETADRRARKFVSANEELDSAHAEAEKLYEQFSGFSAENQNRNLQQTLRKKARKIDSLKSKFQKLMSCSDTELRLASSNRNVDFDQYPFYTRSDADVREKIRNRTLRRDEYNAIRRGLRSSDTIKFNVINIGRSGYSIEDLTRYVGEYLKGVGGRIRLGSNASREVFEGYVLQLFAGAELSQRVLGAKGYDPKLVRDTAMRAYRHFRVDDAEMRRLGDNPPPERMHVSTNYGTDPVAYEEGREIMRPITKKPVRVIRHA